MKQLETVPRGATFDRTYINTAFFIMFPEKRLRRQVKKGISRKDILAKFREADQYQTMKGNLSTKITLVVSELLMKFS